MGTLTIPRLNFEKFQNFHFEPDFLANGNDHGILKITKMKVVNPKKKQKISAQEFFNLEAEETSLVTSDQEDQEETEEDEEDEETEEITVGKKRKRSNNRRYRKHV